MKITLASNVFMSKGEATEFFRKLLKNSAFNQRILPDDALHALLQRHPNAEEKIGCGVSHFLVKADDFGGKCFWLVRTDGTHTDFSYVQCLNNKERNGARQALRDAVKEQIFEFRNQLKPDYPCDVHHIIPFQRLVTAWLQENNISIMDISIKEHGDGMTKNFMADDEQLQSWQAYHRKHAQLKLVPKGDHKKIHGRSSGHEELPKGRNKTA